VKRHTLQYNNYGKSQRRLQSPGKLSEAVKVIPAGVESFRSWKGREGRAVIGN